MFEILGISCVIALIAASGFFSGSETGVYSLSRIRLRLGMEAKQPLYGILSRMMADSQGLVFSILIGNNLVNYAATSVVTLLFLQTLGSETIAQVYATVIMTPVLFIFAEVIPKNLYYYHADDWMPRLSPLLWFFDRLFRATGLVAILKSLSALLSRMSGAGARRQDIVSRPVQRRIEQLIHESGEEGILTPTQRRLMSRLLDIPNLTVMSVLTPISRVGMVEVHTNRRQLLDAVSRLPFTRLLVYQRNPHIVLGFIHAYEALCSDGDFKDLREFIKPLTRVPASMSVLEAIEIMSRNRDKLLLVTADPSARRRLLGLVTMKDLVEEITGELVEW